MTWAAYIALTLRQLQGGVGASPLVAIVEQMSQLLQQKQHVGPLGCALAMAAAEQAFSCTRMPASWLQPLTFTGTCAGSGISTQMRKICCVVCFVFPHVGHLNLQFITLVGHFARTSASLLCSTLWPWRVLLEQSRMPVAAAAHPTLAGLTPAAAAAAVTARRRRSLSSGLGY